jgi:putative transposase
MIIGRVWQYRYWDHIIRNEIDLRRHIDYIHYNPIKHGLVKRPIDYVFSSIHKYREFYPADWGIGIKFDNQNDYGEL